MKRPSARFMGHGHVRANTAPVKAPSVERIQVQLGRLEKHLAIRSGTLALFEDAGVELYSVQVAEAVGCRIAHAACVLRLLETDGVLTSRLERSPTSGNGRRVYRRAR